MTFTRTAARGYIFSRERGVVAGRRPANWGFIGLSPVSLICAPGSGEPHRPLARIPLPKRIYPSHTDQFCLLALALSGRPLRVMQPVPARSGGGGDGIEGRGEPGPMSGWRARRVRLSAWGGRRSRTGGIIREAPSPTPFSSTDTPGGWRVLSRVQLGASVAPLRRPTTSRSMSPIPRYSGVLDPGMPPCRSHGWLRRPRVAHALTARRERPMILASQLPRHYSRVSVPVGSPRGDIPLD
jgi:hypothetical protein